MRDGIETLNRRTSSRLWYRMPLGSDPVAQKSEPLAPAELQVTTMVRAPFDLMLDSASEPLGADDFALTEAEDEYAYFELDTTGMKLRPLDFKDSHVLRVLRGSSVNNAAWRPYPSEAPSLILSATENLSARLMGPILSSGTRYRVVDCYNEVVAIEIERLGLPPMRGYCLAADLEAAEQSARPKRTGKQVEWLRSVSERVSQSLGVIDISIPSAASPSQE
jgi:hypothetical protein